MPNAKASDILVVKQFLRGQGPDVEAKFLSQLSPAAAKAYQNAIATMWMPIKEAFEVYAVSARMLFPNDSNCCRRLGYEINKIQLAGMYKVFRRVSAIEFIVKRISQIWHTYYDAGEAFLEDLAPGKGTLVVAHMPELVATQREYICGFVLSILEYIGIKNIAIRQQDDNPQAWKWLVTWKT